jgi:hypothetical protein
MVTAPCESVGVMRKETHTHTHTRTHTRTHTHAHTRTHTHTHARAGAQGHRGGTSLGSIKSSVNMAPFGTPVLPLVNRTWEDGMTPS